jgi:hypothetical protein
LRQLTLIAWAAPLGFAAGLAAWLVAGGASAGFGRLDSVESRLAALRPPPPARASGPSGAGSELLANPLFVLTTGPGAVREPSIRLDGLSVTKRRTAALISIDGKPSVWLAPGETSEGVTLTGITGSGATFETVVGVHTLTLGQQSAESGPDPKAAASAPAVALADKPPPGGRGPPEPASAPKAR